MNTNPRLVRPLAGSAAFMAIVLALACGSTGEGSRSPIFGTGGPVGNNHVPPQVSSTSPATSQPGPTLGMPANGAVTATFTVDLAPGTLSGTTFTLSGPGQAPIPGTVTYAYRTATFRPSAPLSANTSYKATITSAVTDAAGSRLCGNQGIYPAASDYTWTFTTSAGLDLTRPRVALAMPDPALPASVTTSVTATFTEDMVPDSINAASFTLMGPGSALVAGNVTYASRTGILTPVLPLVLGTTYTATVTTAATDLSGNALAGNQAALPAASSYVWTFTTGAVAPAAPTITLQNPSDLGTGVSTGTSISATFSMPMNPATLTAATFTVRPFGPPQGMPVLGTVSYDAVSRTATFSPSSPLGPTTKYTATVACMNLAGASLAAGLLPNPWTFTTGSTGVAQGALPMGTAATFGIMATSAISNTGAATMVNGDVSLEPGTSLGLLPIQVNGAIHINDTVSHQARTDLLAAYTFAKTLPPGTTVPGGADLAGLYPLGVPPGTYTSGSTMLVSTPLILDAMGDANAVWVFQIGSSFTTTADVSLVNGAQAKNVFWVPTLDATIGVGSIFNGNIVTGRDASVKTGAVINGRVLAGATLAGTITLDTTTVNVPSL